MGGEGKASTADDSGVNAKGTPLLKKTSASHIANHSPSEKQFIVLLCPPHLESLDDAWPFQQKMN
jgi:hypothetical protein